MNNPLKMVQRISERHSKLLRTAMLTRNRLIDVFTDLQNIGSGLIIEKEDDFAIKLLFAGYNIQICLKKNIEKIKCCIQWHYLFFDNEELKPKAKLIFENYVDNSGNVYLDDSFKDSDINFDNSFNLFVLQTLVDFTIEVDQLMNSEFKVLKSNK